MVIMGILRRSDIIKIGKPLKRRHIEGILEAIISGIISAFVEGLNNKIITAFSHSYWFKAQQ